MTERDSSAKAQIKLRLREPLRARLEEEAKKGGFSLNSEIVRRLHNSLVQDDVGAAVFHDRDVFALANTFATLVRAFQIQRQRTWASDPEICRLAADALCALMNKGPKLIESGTWPGGLRTLADQGALAMIQQLLQIDEEVRENA